MAKTKDTITKEAQTQEVAQNSKDSGEIQEKTPKIKTVALNLHKKPKSIRSKPKKKK